MCLRGVVLPDLFGDLRRLAEPWHKIWVSIFHGDGCTGATARYAWASACVSQSIMVQESDGLVALPCSCGILDELLHSSGSVWGLDISPIVLLNVGGVFGLCISCWNSVSTVLTNMDHDRFRESDRRGPTTKHMPGIRPSSIRWFIGLVPTRSDHPPWLEFSRGKASSGGTVSECSAKGESKQVFRCDMGA